jgi:hypothetical protein
LQRDPFSPLIDLIWIFPTAVEQKHFRTAHRLFVTFSRQAYNAEPHLLLIEAGQ